MLVLDEKWHMVGKNIFLFKLLPHATWPKGIMDTNLLTPIKHYVKPNMIWFITTSYVLLQNFKKKNVRFECSLLLRYILVYPFYLSVSFAQK